MLFIRMNFYHENSFWFPSFGRNVHFLHILMWWNGSILLPSKSVLTLSRLTKTLNYASSKITTKFFAFFFFFVDVHALQKAKIAKNTQQNVPFERYRNSQAFKHLHYLSVNCCYMTRVGWIKWCCHQTNRHVILKFFSSLAHLNQPSITNQVANWKKTKWNSFWYF